METVQKLIEKGFKVEFIVTTKGRYCAIVTAGKVEGTVWNSAGEKFSLTERLAVEAETFERLLSNLPFEVAGLLNSNYWK